MGFIKKIIVHFIATGLAIVGTDYFLDEINIQSSSQKEYIEILLLFIVIFSILNIFVKPILKIISFPLMMSTLGVFSIVINAVLLFLVTLVIPKVEVMWWQGYLFVPIVLFLFNWIAHKIVRVRKD